MFGKLRKSFERKMSESFDGKKRNSIDGKVDDIDQDVLDAVDADVLDDIDANILEDINADFDDEFDEDMDDEIDIEVEGEDGNIVADGYALTEITIRKLAKKSFRAKFAFHVSFQMLQDVIADHGKVFGLRRAGLIADGPIEVVFTLRIADNSYTCESIYFSDGLSSTERERITRHIRLEVARMALLGNCHENRFLGEPLPELIREVGSPNWIIGVCFGVIYTICFKSLVGSLPASISIGFCLGLAMAYVFRSVKYHFKSGTKCTGSN